MVRDKARLRRGHRNDQSRQGHQCSETTLTGESRFHMSTPWRFEPGSLVTGSKWVQPFAYLCEGFASDMSFSNTARKTLSLIKN